jgi:hypothetical protein
MTQLGSVVGALLAELTRARVVADHLTRELVAEYEGDPVLATMNVPRMAIGEATVTVRYAVDEVVEPVAIAPGIDRVRRDWAEHLEAKVLPAVAARLALDEAGMRTLVQHFTPAARAPTATQLKAAMGGSEEAAVATTVESVMGLWSTLPPADRRRIGRKVDFRSALERVARTELAGFLREARRTALVAAVLGSRLEVSITRDQLADDPGRIQELTLTIRSEDVDFLLGEEG